MIDVRVLIPIVLFAAPALACTNIYGIPGECRMRVVVCDPRGTEQVEVMSVVMENNWSYSACSPSSDGAANVLFVGPDHLDVQYRGRRRSIPRGPYYPHSVEWDSSERRFAFWAPLEEGTPARRRLAVCDVRAMSASPAYQIVYEAPKTSAPFGFMWIPDQDALLVIEQRLVEDITSGAVVRVDVATGEARDLVVEEGAIDFAMTRHHSSAGAASKALVGSRNSLRLVDCVTGDAQRLPGLPGMGLHNLELSQDGRRAALFYRRAVPAEDGRTFVGVYLVDFAKVVAGEADGARQLYDGFDVHTLWLSPSGDEVLWATPWSVSTWSVSAPVAETKHVLAATDDLEIKGAAYDASGSRIAITLGNRLLVHDAADGTTSEVTRFGEAAQTFAAEPRWVHGRVMVSVFHDSAGQPRRSRVDLGTPNRPTGDKR